MLWCLAAGRTSAGPFASPTPTRRTTTTPKGRPPRSRRLAAAAWCAAVRLCARACFSAAIAAWPRMAARSLAAPPNHLRALKRVSCGPLHRNPQRPRPMRRPRRLATPPVQSCLSARPVLLIRSPNRGNPLEEKFLPPRLFCRRAACHFPPPGSARHGLTRHGYVCAVPCPGPGKESVLGGRRRRRRQDNGHHGLVRAVRSLLFVWLRPLALHRGAGPFLPLVFSTFPAHTRIYCKLRAPRPARTAACLAGSRRALACFPRWLTWLQKKPPHARARAGAFQVRR